MHFPWVDKDKHRNPSVERQTAAIGSVWTLGLERIAGEAGGGSYRRDKQHKATRRSRGQWGAHCRMLGELWVEHRERAWYVAGMVAAKRGLGRKASTATRGAESLERASLDSVERSKQNERGRRVSDETLRRALDEVRARCDVEVRRAADPVHFVHRYERREDQEIVALIAASLAFGNVKALCAKIEEALARLGPRIAAIADDEDDVFSRLKGFRHRLYGGQDLARLVVGARRMQQTYGSLGESLRRQLTGEKSFREALGIWVTELRKRGGFPAFGVRDSVGADHLLPDPTKGSAIKRLNLFLRWMVRPADGVDLGLWDISPSRLVIPLDTHIHKLSRNIGLTLRKAADYRAAEEITAALARLDPRDPTKYDFSLCHLGMVQSCPSRKDDVRCRGCGVKPVCRHWHSSLLRRAPP